MPFDRSKYPDNWEEVSEVIRFQRAKGQCEWVEAGNRCEAKHGEPHPITGSKVVLTTAHLEDENPMNCALENLMAMCQMHHLRYDRNRRAQIIYLVHEPEMELHYKEMTAREILELVKEIMTEEDAVNCIADFVTAFIKAPKGWHKLTDDAKAEYVKKFEHKQAMRFAGLKQLSIPLQQPAR